MADKGRAGAADSAPSGDTSPASSEPPRAAAMVYVQSTIKAPIIVPTRPRNVELAAGRITPVDAEVWAKFKASEFGKVLIDDGCFEEVSADEHAAQPRTPAQEADEAEAAEVAENVAARRTSKTAKK